jgi:hypothetical protein
MPHFFMSLQYSGMNLFVNRDLRESYFCMYEVPLCCYLLGYAINAAYLCRQNSSLTFEQESVRSEPDLWMKAKKLWKYIC